MFTLQYQIYEIWPIFTRYFFDKSEINPQTALRALTSTDGNSLGHNMLLVREISFWYAKDNWNAYVLTAFPSYYPVLTQRWRLTKYRWLRLTWQQPIKRSLRRHSNFLWPPLKIHSCFQLRTMALTNYTIMSTCDSRRRERISYYLWYQDVLWYNVCPSYSKSAWRSKSYVWVDSMIPTFSPSIPQIAKDLNSTGPVVKWSIF